MDRERARELLPIITAFAEGKAIQVRNVNGVDPGWIDFDENENPRFEIECYDFRIKPEARVVFLYDSKGDPNDVWLGGWPTENTIKQEGLVKFREVLDD